VPLGVPEHRISDEQKAQAGLARRSPPGRRSANRIRTRGVIIMVMRSVIGAVIVASVGLTLGNVTAAAATPKDHHVQSVGAHHQRRDVTPFCGKGIVPMNRSSLSKPSAPSNAKSSATTLLPCYKLKLPSGMRTTRP
jgi:hypothetical protein